MFRELEEADPEATSSTDPVPRLGAVHLQYKKPDPDEASVVLLQVLMNYSGVVYPKLLLKRAGADPSYVSNV